MCVVFAYIPFRFGRANSSDRPNLYNTVRFECSQSAALAGCEGSDGREKGGLALIPQIRQDIAANNSEQASLAHAVGAIRLFRDSRFDRPDDHRIRQAFFLPHDSMRNESHLTAIAISPPPQWGVVAACNKNGEPFAIRGELSADWYQPQDCRVIIGSWIRLVEK